MALSHPNPFMPLGEIQTGIIPVDFGDKMVSEKPEGFAISQIWIWSLAILFANYLTFDHLFNFSESFV